MFLLFKIREIFAVFPDFDRFEPRAVRGFLAHESVENVEQMRRQPFRGTVVEDVRLEQVRERREHLQPFRVGFREEARVVEMFGNPLADEFDAAEIDDEAEMIQLLARERQRQRPIVPVHERTMPRVPMLNVPYRDVRVNFLAGMHKTGKV